MSLSSGAALKDGMSQDENDLVAAFIMKNGVTKLPPVGVAGTELSRQTRDRLSKLRKDFRKKTELKK